jgi:quercetin dioxygenase-like cupin family protein
MSGTARLSGAIAVMVVLLVGARVYSNGNQAAPESATHAMVNADQVTFAPTEIPGFDSGVKIAAVHGDPNATSGFYVIRLALPDGYKIPPHWHPMAENATVLEGELMLGMGDTVDVSKVAAYKPGSFLYIPGKMSHFGSVKGATVIQLHGQAPFKIELTKPGGTR